MKRSLAVFTVLLAFAGLLSFITGMTGLVIGESCCIGFECDVENVCDIAKDPVAPSSNDFFFLGFICVMVAGMIYVRTHHL